MANFKILIIDDDPNRESELLGIFHDERFEITFIFDRKIFRENANSLQKYHCVISDISLDHWIEDGERKNMFYSVIEQIGKKMPIILYSLDIRDVLDWTSRLREQDYNLIYTFALTRNDNNGIICSVEKPQVVSNNIYHFLSLNYNYANLSLQKDDDITILHISDLQFGDPKFNQNLCNSFESTLTKSIRDKDVPKIDFVAITGDITYDGTPNQYKEAKSWITSLCKSIFDSDNFQDRLLLVPGNHDANLSLCSLNKYKYHFPHNGDTEGEIKLDEREKEIEDYSIYSFDPFRDFAFSLTKDENWLNKDSMSFINAKFSYLGLNFIHLNVLSPNEQLGYMEAKFKLENNLISELRNEYNKLRFSNNVKSIVLIHASPKQLGYEIDENHRGNWIAIANFLKTLNASIYMFGHRHINLTKNEIPIDNETSIKLCGAATLLCEPDSGERRGFKVMSIKRKDDTIYDFNISSYDYKNNATIIRI